MSSQFHIAVEQGHWTSKPEAQRIMAATASILASLRRLLPLAVVGGKRCRWRVVRWISDLGSESKREGNVEEESNMGL